LASFTAFLDASVLYPAPLRDLLMEVAVSDLYRAKWSAAVHDEWINALLRTRTDLSREKLERTRDMMNAHARDALVTDFEDMIGILTLSPTSPCWERKHLPLLIPFCWHVFQHVGQL
jgi:hypothetical protein